MGKEKWVKLAIFSFIITMYAVPALASFSMGEPPEKVEVRYSEPPSGYEDITGHAISEQKTDGSIGHITFLIALITAFIGAAIFLFQRVKPR